MCGLVGIVSRENDVVPMVYISLGQLQHRGKESAGIASAHLGFMHRILKGVGEVISVFDKDALSRISGTSAIGHVRYGTAGKSGAENAQPIEGLFHGKYPFCVAHNGNIVNTSELWKILGRSSSYDFSDTQLIVDLISCSPCLDFEDALIDVAKKLQGSFNFLILFNDRMYALTDRFGFHPLVLGKLGADYIVASESCVFDHLNAEFVCDIEPGTLLSVHYNSISSARWSTACQLRFDIFEFVYFARPDSVIHGVEVGSTRRKTGIILADEHPMFGADIVVPVPDSGKDAAWGYARGMKHRKSSIDFEPDAITRSHVVSRTFTEPVKERRHSGVHLKFNMREALFAGKHVVLVDDSIVRCNTMPITVSRVRRAHAKSVSAVIASPPCLYPDIYGMDTNRDPHELVAWRERGDIERIKDQCGLEHLGYVSLEGMIQGVLRARSPHSPLTESSFYLGSFTGEYPDGEGDHADKIASFKY